jgi:hypothetical protein
MMKKREVWWKERGERGEEKAEKGGEGTRKTHPARASFCRLSLRTTHRISSKPVKQTTTIDYHR